MTSTAQDSSADSNVWNTQGPSANHGSINFNFHVNNENFTSPMGLNSGQARNLDHVEQLMKQNNFLKSILSQIAPSILPEGSRRKRSVEEETTPRTPLWKKPILRPGGRKKRPRIVCFRPSPLCPPRKRLTTTTARPIFPLPLLSTKHKPSECVLNYFEKALQTFKVLRHNSDSKKLNNHNILGK